MIIDSSVLLGNRDIYNICEIRVHIHIIVLIRNNTTTGFILGLYKFKCDLKNLIFHFLSYFMYFKVYFQLLPSMLIKETKKGRVATKFELYFTSKLFEIGTLKKVTKKSKLKLKTNSQHRTYLPM